MSEVLANRSICICRLRPKSIDCSGLLSISFIGIDAVHRWLEQPQKCIEVYNSLFDTDDCTADAHNLADMLTDAAKAAGNKENAKIFLKASLADSIRNRIAFAVFIRQAVGPMRGKKASRLLLREFDLRMNRQSVARQFNYLTVVREYPLLAVVSVFKTAPATEWLLTTMFATSAGIRYAHEPVSGWCTKVKEIKTSLQALMQDCRPLPLPNFS